MRTRISSITILVIKEITMFKEEAETIKINGMPVNYINFSDNIAVIVHLEIEMNKMQLILRKSLKNSS